MRPACCTEPTSATREIGGRRKKPSASLAAKRDTRLILGRGDARSLISTVRRGARGHRFGTRWDRRGCLAGERRGADGAPRRGAHAARSFAMPTRERVREGSTRTVGSPLASPTRSGSSCKRVSMSIARAAPRPRRRDRTARCSPRLVGASSFASAASARFAAYADGRSARSGRRQRDQVRRLRQRGRDPVRGRRRRPHRVDFDRRAGRRATAGGVAARGPP